MMKKTIGMTLLTGIVLILLAACASGAGGSAGGDPLAGTSWSLVSLGGSNLVAGTEISAQFEDNQITGMACNNYFGEYKVSDEAIAIGQMGSTEMFCMEPAGAMDQESAYFAMLMDAETFTLQGDRLTITTASGGMLVFVANG